MRSTQVDFHHRLAEKLPGLPLYLYVTHHAVWRAPDGRLIDVTPYPSDRHKPFCVENSPLFLLDDKAKPVMAGGQPAPLPSRFFAVDDAAGLAEYVDELNRREQSECQELYRLAATQSPTGNNNPA